MNKFKTLCNILENMKNPKEARDQIADYLKELSSEDQIIACNFMLGKPLENDAVGYSKRTVQKVIDIYYDYDKSKKFETLGDMFSGELDKKCNESTTLEEVYNSFKMLAINSCSKEEYLHGELLMFDDLEKKYFINILLNKLRVRIGMNVLSYSLSEVHGYPQKWVNNLYKKYESMKDVIEILCGKPDKLMIGKPAKPQLAKDISKHMDRIEYPVLAEPKFDGSRAQVHVHEDGKIQIFSRSLKDKTDSFPDVVELLKENNIQPGIYDGEIFGINSDGSLMSFNKYQHRINNIKSVNVDEYPVTIRLFDILMWGLEDITNLPQKDRTKIIMHMCPKITGGLLYINNKQELLDLHKKHVNVGYEGVMIKNPSGTYNCGRGKSEWNNWFKYKPSIIRCDVVITGATFGTGDNVSLLSSFDIAVLDTDHMIRDTFVDGPEYALKSVGKCGIGFDQVTLELLTERIMKSCNNKLEDYNCLETPIIIEVNPQEITKNESGNFGMRFPVYIGERTDKNILDIDSIEIINQYIT